MNGGLQLFSNLTAFQTPPANQKFHVMRGKISYNLFILLLSTFTNFDRYRL
jgi:hypothetical protein